MNTDENQNLESQDGAKSDAATNADAGSEAVKTPAGEKQIPYSRFKEVIDERNEFKSNLESMKQEIASLKTTLKPKEEEKEPETWKEVEERATQRALREMEAKTVKEREAETAQEQAIEKEFAHLQKLGANITPEIKREVLTEMIKTGNGDLTEVYLGVKERFSKQIKTEQQKQEAVISNSKGAEGGTPRLAYSQLRKMSLDRVVERVAQSQAKVKK